MPRYIFGAADSVHPGGISASGQNLSQGDRRVRRSEGSSRLTKRAENMACRTSPRDPRPSQHLNRFTVPIPDQVLSRYSGRVLDPDEPSRSAADPSTPRHTSRTSSSSRVRRPQWRRSSKPRSRQGHDIGTRSPAPKDYTDALGEAALAELAAKMWSRGSRWRQMPGPAPAPTPGPCCRSTGSSSGRSLRTSPSVSITW